MPSIRIVDPLKHPGWDELVLSFGGYSFFHSRAWAEVLYLSYSYEPVYICSFDGETLASVIPLMEVRSFLTGKRGVSLPFTDYCNPLTRSDALVSQLFDQLIELGKERGWRYIEFRLNSFDSQATFHLDSYPSPLPSYASYVGHVIELNCDQEKMFQGFRDSVKRNVRKAKKQGVGARISDSLDALREFYGLHCLTRRDHSLPPQPWAFFERVYEGIIHKGFGFVVLTYFEEQAISGAVFFHFGKKALYKYGASDRRYQQLRASNLVMWEAVKWFGERGYQTLCLGRTDPEDEGLLQFKAGWRPSPCTIPYFRYDFEKGSFVSGSAKTSHFETKVAKYLPLPILKVAGSLLYRHMA